MQSLWRPALLALLILSYVTFVSAQTTEFTYQGSLRDGANLANGSYDFEFALYDSLVGGVMIATPLVRNAVVVSNGSFAVKLDFGNQFPGADRYLEIRVRPSGGAGITILAPRQQLNSSPYSVRSLSADAASTATNAASATNALSLGGIAAGQYVLTGDSRLSDARNPLPDSNNYVQNRNAGYQSANFAITGTAKAYSFDAASAGYLIFGIRVLGIEGTSNLFLGNSGLANTTGESNALAGIAAGYSNTTGSYNSFFGKSAGYKNTSGYSNSFFGESAGYYTTTGTYNTFLGAHTGNNNTIGSNNSFVGYEAGLNNFSGNYNTFVGFSTGESNTVEDSNTFVGYRANGAPGINRSTAVGYRSQVTQSNSLVLGSIDGVNGSTINTNVGIGTTAPGNRLHVVGLFNSTATPANHVALIENSSTGTSPDGLAIKIGKLANPDDSNNFITFFKGDNTSAGSIQGNGTGGVMLGGAGADYAEWLPRLDPNEKIEPGDIVGVFGGRISKATAGASQVMTVSTGAIIAGNDPGEKRRETHSLVAFIGQAMVNVIGAVRAGDYIIPSRLEDGSGMAVSPDEITAAQFAQVIGQAWEGSDGTGPRSVRAAVGLIRHDPNIARLLERIAGQQRQIDELKQLVCLGNRQVGICKE